MGKSKHDSLLSVLGGYLRYELKVRWENCDYGDKVKNLVSIDEFGMVNDEFPIEDCKPYLRPFSSMTEEEQEDFKFFFGNNFWGNVQIEKGDYIQVSDAWDNFTIDVCVIGEMVRWFCKHRFDYMGFIEKGYAISTEEFNPYKE